MEKNCNLGLFSHFGFKGNPKIEYKTIEKAQRAAEIMKKRHEIEFVPYYCPLCQNYHIGKDIIGIKDDKEKEE